MIMLAMGVTNGPTVGFLAIVGVDRKSTSFVDI